MPATQRDGIGAWRAWRPLPPPWLIAETAGGGTETAGPARPSVNDVITASRYPSSAQTASPIPATAVPAVSGGVQEADWTVQELLERIERLEAQVLY
jgi:hypothetical protein